MSLRVLAIALLLAHLRAGGTTPSFHSIEFPAARIPRYLWPRELIWMHNIGASSIETPNAPDGLAAVAHDANLEVTEGRGKEAARVSVLAPDAVLQSRKAVFERRGVVWTDVESEVTPVFHRGAVALSGTEDTVLQGLRRELSVARYWGAVLTDGSRHRETGTHLPDSIEVDERATASASALNVLNTSKQAWHGDVRAYLPTLKRAIQIPNVTVPAQDALLLPVDVSFTDPRFCRSCSGMSNSERLLYATAELTAMEYENGILSFEFYAPNAGSAVLQLEREPNGPMLAGGRLVAFDWDVETKRAKLPIPVGKGAGKRVRIAITMSAPDEVASFVDAKTLVIGQTNRVVTEYSSEGLAKRSRLMAPEGWKAAGTVKSPTQVVYALDVPANRLHGDYADMRLEADGIGMSHVRVQLLRSVSVHVAEAESLHFGSAAEMVGDPPLIAVESPTGRNLTIQLRNNAPEIRTFRVEIAGEQLEFSPPRTEISVGASMEREISVRVFSSSASAGLHAAVIRVTGAVSYEKPLRFLVIPRGGSVNYDAALTDTGNVQTVWENSRLRAVFAKPDGGRWLEFYWKESGRSLLPPEGIALTGAAKIALAGDELTIEGAAGLPDGSKSGNIDWQAERQGTVTKYRVREAVAR